MSQWGRFFLTHFASKNESERNVPIYSFRSRPLFYQISILNISTTCSRVASRGLPG